MRPSVCLSFIVLLTFLISCEFQPEGEVFTEVNPPSLEGLSIDLENHPEQEILLKTVTQFHYSVQAPNKKIIETRALLKNSTVWTTTTAQGSFELDPADLETGSYKLRIEFTATSETGSLAEKVGAEVVYVWMERTIVVNHNVPQNPGDPGAITITSVENIDYSVKVTWTPYTNFNFEKYEVIRQDFDEQGKQTTGRVMPVMSLDANYTSVFDDQYLGGKSHYMVKLYADGKTYTSPPFVYQHPYSPDIAYDLKADGNVTITWRSISALKNNFSGYTLDVIDYVGGRRQETPFDLYSASDTSVTFAPENFHFGKVKDLKLTIHTSSAANYYSKVHYSEMRNGDAFPVFYGALSFNAETKKFYYQTLNKILHVADENGVPLDSLNRAYTFLNINNSIGVGTLNYKNYRINLATMEEEGLVPVPDGNVFSLSNDNKMGIFISGVGPKIFTSTGEEVLAIPTGGSNYRGLSPDGQYFFFQPHMYKFNGTAFEEWKPWYAVNILTASFIPTEPTKVIFGEEDRIRIFDFAADQNDLTSLAYTGPCNLDPVSNKLGCLNGDQFVILNRDDLTLYKSLTVDAGGVGFYLLNGSVICSSGAQIKLSDIP